jgi:hypothetical protein
MLTLFVGDTAGRVSFYFASLYYSTFNGCPAEHTKTVLDRAENCREYANGLLSLP